MAEEEEATGGWKGDGKASKDGGKEGEKAAPWLNYERPTGINIFAGRATN